jgi:GH15 family glucan-1,4-alpha-glucosidase
MCQLSTRAARNPTPAGDVFDNRDNDLPYHPMSAPIESYGMIGDCKTAALVGLDGAIDWLCWPRFDSDACFAKLLGGQSNGFWLITPSEAPLLPARHDDP